MRSMAKRLTIELLAMVAIGLLMGLLGPFGTYPMVPGERMAVWVIWILLGYALFRPTGVVAGWLCEATGLPPVAGTLLAMAVACFPLTLIVTMMAGHASLSEALRYDGFWTMYASIVIVAGVVTLAMKALFGRADAGAASDPVPPAPTPSPPHASPPVPPPPAAEGLARRLPPGFGPLLALKGEDHYVRAIGAAREELILLRLSDAIAELPADAGLRVHRSWWVARDAVRRVERDGRAARLILSNDTEAPVSREAMARLRDAGWL